MWQHTNRETEWLMMAFSWFGILLLFGKITHCLNFGIHFQFFFFNNVCLIFLWFVLSMCFLVSGKPKVLLFFCPFENHVLDHQHPYFSIVLLLLQQCIIWSILVAIILNTEKKKMKKNVIGKIIITTTT